MTPKDFIQQKEKNKLMFTIKPFQSRETCSLWRSELEECLKEYAEIEIKSSLLAFLKWYREQK